MPLRVELTIHAQAELVALPVVVMARVRDVLVRLADWPAVSGAKPMRKSLKGSFRIRTGDYRIIFHVTLGAVVVTRVGIRRDVYED